MNDQTKDNFRCLIAVVFVIAIPVGVFAAQSIWLPSLPGWIPLIVFVLLLPVALYNFNSRKSNGQDRVVFDDVQITRTLPDGKTEIVRWCDLQEIGIITTDEGPASEDVYWMLIGKAGGCAISGGAEGLSELLTRFQTLAGFDNEVVIKAMGSTSNAKFVCWRRVAEYPIV
jgi:hypothetical protein